MIKLYIDHQEVEIADDTSLKISASAGKLADLEAVKEERYPIRIPMTGRNRLIMGHSEQLLSAWSFNRIEHPAWVEFEGATLVSGKVQLMGCETDENGSGWYALELIVPEPEWIREVRTKRMREVALAYEEVISASLIEQSWTADTPVRYLPVQRDRYPAAEFENEVAPLRIITYEDYHPFFRIKSLLDAMVAPSGYRIESEFLNEPFFQSLYMSGYYPTKDVSRFKKRMNFLAGRLQDTSATADSYGNVYTVPGQPFSSVGNLVDTADPYEMVDGNRIAGAFNNGNCFRKKDNRTAFIPQEEVTVGFEYRLRFRSDYTIGAGGKLIGFTEIRLEDGILHEIEGPEAPENRRDGRTAGNYAVVIPGLTSQRLGRITVTYLNHTQESFTITGNGQIVSIGADFSSITVESQLPDGSFQVNDHWMMYDPQEYREATQNVETDVTLRSTPVLRKKNEPCYFDGITFKGAESGMSLTLLQGTTVRPIFYAHPMLGSRVTVNELIAHDAYQIKLFEGLAHLFNLRFYTDSLNKTIRIEPWSLFFPGDREIDWTENIDPAKAIGSEEPANNRYQTEAYSYAADDGSVTRWNQENQQRYAYWEATMESAYGKSGERKRVNPLFSPTRDQTMGYAQAWSASLIKVGDRDGDYSGLDDGDLNFPAKIVRYLGMKAFPEGERWGWPSGGRKYPLVMFHSKGEDQFTLCFDNFEGQLGLMNYYAPEYEVLNKGKLLTLFLHLTPSDLEAIRYPNPAGRNFRGCFVFAIRGEKIRCRLEEVLDYDPVSPESTRCVFIKEP